MSADLVLLADAAEQLGYPYPAALSDPCLRRPFVHASDLARILKESS